MSAPTPGPWLVRNESEVVAAGRLIVTPVDGAFDAEDAANARLIAAAPDLLAFVQAVVATVNHHDVAILKTSLGRERQEYIDAFLSDMRDAVKDARAAIRKAAGND